MTNMYCFIWEEVFVIVVAAVFKGGLKGVRLTKLRGIGGKISN